MASWVERRRAWRTTLTDLKTGWFVFFWKRRLADANAEAAFHQALV
jgi:hypothetical protein